MSRVIAIAGRPNVGKSALFNRIVGARVAIVHEAAGVTRDRIAREVVCGGDAFELIDTGGLGQIDNAAAPDEIARGIRLQADAAVQDAAVVLMVVDATAGRSPLDEEVARLLRRSGRPVLVAANKCDHEGLDRLAGEFEALGFPVLPVSAIHDRGVDELVARALPLLPREESPTRSDPLRVAFVGKPNAGKSSLVNRILRHDRVIVSAEPGTTRDSIEIPFAIGQGPAARHYVLVDTAGLRHIRRAETAVERYSVMRAERSIAEADLAVLVLDAVQGPTQQDKKIASMILEERKGCLLLVSKWDLAGDVTQRAYERALRAALPFLAFAPVVFASAKTGFNVRRCIDAVDHVAAQIGLDLPTGTLNRILHGALERVQPPLVKGRRMKLYYATQTGGRPVRLRLFVNYTDLAPPAYRQYLVNLLRDSFGLEGAPIVLDFRSSHASARGSDAVRKHRR
jgi:GTP-binding protein